jgi:hypothetical protein
MSTKIAASSITPYQFDPTIKFATKPSTPSGFALPRQEDSIPTKQSEFPKRMTLTVGTNSGVKTRLEKMLEADLFAEMAIFDKPATNGPLRNNNDSFWHELS